MRVTVRFKLAATFAVVIAMAAAGMLVATSNLSSLNASFDKAVNENVRRVTLASHISLQTARLSREAFEIILTTSPVEMRKIETAMEEQIADIETTGTELEKLSSAVGKVKVNEFRRAFEAYVNSHAEIVRLAKANSNDEAFRIASTTDAAARRAVTEAIEGVVTLNTTQ